MYASYYMVEVEQRYRDNVLFPRAARNARHLRDLELQDHALGRPRRVPAPVRWLANALAGVRGRLGGLGMFPGKGAMAP